MRTASSAWKRCCDGLHPAHGLLTPEHFLASAEEDGLIVPITHFIIERACELSRQWRARMPPGDSFYISINLSPMALLDPELGSHVDDTRADMKIP